MLQVGACKADFLLIRGHMHAGGDSRIAYILAGLLSTGVSRDVLTARHLIPDDG